MNRFFVAPVLMLLAGAPAFAQDMPLSQILIAREGWKKVEKPGAKPSAREGVVMYRTHSPDRGTVFIASGHTAFIGAAQTGADGEAVVLPSPYAELRTPRGARAVEVTGLTTDRDGRIYATTEIGVQVFDPTGRLCGVLTPAAKGKSEHLAFEGDTLTLWIGDTKYARKLNTRGVK